MSKGIKTAIAPPAISLKFNDRFFSYDTSSLLPEQCNYSLLSGRGS
jgi:hypothetical protein